MSDWAFGWHLAELPQTWHHGRLAGASFPGLVAGCEVSTWMAATVFLPALVPKVCPTGTVPGSG